MPVQEVDLCHQPKATVLHVGAVLASGQPGKQVAQRCPADSASSKYSSSLGHSRTQAMPVACMQLRPCHPQYKQHQPTELSTHKPHTSSCQWQGRAGRTRRRPEAGGWAAHGRGAAHRWRPTHAGRRPRQPQRRRARHRPRRSRRAGLPRGHCRLEGRRHLHKTKPLSRMPLRATLQAIGTSSGFCKLLLWQEQEACCLWLL